MIEHVRLLMTTAGRPQLAGEARRFLLESSRDSQLSGEAVRHGGRDGRANPLVASFMYHDVTDDPTTSGFQRARAESYKITRSAFARHLDWFALVSALPTSVWEIDFERPGRHVLLTFDDGGKSALYSGDELLQRGWNGHFFVITNRIGQRGFLNAAEIRYLRACGHVVGSHSHTHPNIFREHPNERVAEEWRISRDRLSDILGEPCTVASIPGGHISTQVLTCTVEAGFTHLFTSEPWLKPRALGGCRILGRYAVTKMTSPRRIGRLAQFDGWSSALVVRRVKVAMQMMLPGLYRHYDEWMTREAQPPRESVPTAAETRDD